MYKQIYRQILMGIDHFEHIN